MQHPLLPANCRTSTQASGTTAFALPFRTIGNLLSFVLCACLLLTLFLPASLAEDPVKIIFWHSMGGVNGEAINKMVADFNAANAGKIEVEV